jgi:putative IMPACT (imprinted ancient) family translation regulator
MSQHDTTVSNTYLSDEIEAINAIYGTEVVTSIANSSYTKEGTDHLVLRPPDQTISFLVSFDYDYPQTCPHIDGTQSTGALVKGEGQHAVKLMQDTLGEVWTPGSVCLFDLIEEVGPSLAKLQDGAVEPGHPAAVSEKSEARSLVTSGTALTSPDADANAKAIIPSRHTSSPSPTTQWIVSEPIMEKKSVFIARCISITSKTAATSVLAELLASNKKVAAATHNITAWRIRNIATEGGLMAQDCDDDGEAAAGGRLLHLLQVMDVWNVLVLVTRWYGGVKLGPDRFRLINQAAREALLRGRFVRMEEEKASTEKKKKKQGKS